jgi:hypothetical protein
VALKRFLIKFIRFCYRVITGLRLSKKGNSIIPEIQVAKVSIFGLIDKSTQEWVGPKSQNLCQSIKTLSAANPTKLSQGVLTQIQLFGERKKLRASGKKLDFWTGKLSGNSKKNPKGINLKDAVSINTEPVYVSTTVAGAGIEYDKITKTISPILIAQNMATMKV